MSFPIIDTAVTYPAGGLAGSATILSSTPLPNGRFAILTDSTPFHPIDPRWPDQGPDTGIIVAAGYPYDVLDCVIGATDGNELFVGNEIPVRRGAPGWAFVVVHILDEPMVIGSVVDLSVEPERRRALSVGHTACHVAALALNATFAPRWNKDVRVDGIGNPDFDQVAIESSRIVPDGAVDKYRLGKSLRKKGFNFDGLARDLPMLAVQANELLALWVTAGSRVQLEVDGPGLTDLRTWICELPTGTQRVPCGGTHLDSLSEVSQITISFDYDEAAGSLTMKTTAIRAQ